MATIGRFPHRTILAVSLALCCGGAWAAYSEAKSYLGGGITSQERFAALAAGQQVARGLSIASAHLVLSNCHEALKGIYGTLQPKSRRIAAATTCLLQADAITRPMPSHSYGWYVGALAALALDDDTAFADRLQQSQRTGPNEQWVAELRVELAEDNIDRLPDGVRRWNDKDLALLVTSYRGVASIAGRYVQNPTFRERITAIVEQLPQDEQKRFLDNVRIAANGAGRTE